MKTILFPAAIAMLALSVIGLFQVYDELPPQAIGATILFGTVSLLAIHRLHRGVRQCMDQIANDEMILCHCIRAPIGAAFLVMAQHDLLPKTFADRAGYGDLAIAFLSVLVVVLGAKIQSPGKIRSLQLTWSVFGLIDLLTAVSTGLYLGLTREGSMDWIARLPLLAVPTIVLPCLFASHFILLSRLLRSGLLKQQPASAVPAHWYLFTDGR